MNSFVDQKDYLRFGVNLQRSIGGATERKRNSSKVLNNNNNKNNNNNNNNKNSKYIPPNKRRNGRKNKVDNNSFNNDTKNFPELSSSSYSKSKENTKEDSINFASLFKKKEKKVYDVKPGWVKITRNNKKKVFKYGKSTKKYYINKTENMDEDTKQALLINKTLNNLIERWQNERDEINDVFEQWSPYWNEKNLREPLSDNEYETSDEEQEYDNDTEYDEYDEYLSDYDI